MNLREEIQNKQKRLEEIRGQITRLNQEQTTLERDLRSLSLTLKVSQGRRVVIDMRYGLVERIRQ